MRQPALVHDDSLSQSTAIVLAITLAWSNRHETQLDIARPCEPLQRLITVVVNDISFCYHLHTQSVLQDRL
jgi:hypothetical protein